MKSSTKFLSNFLRGLQNGARQKLVDQRVREGVKRQNIRKEVMVELDGERGTISECLLLYMLLLKHEIFLD